MGLKQTAEGRAVLRFTIPGAPATKKNSQRIARRADGAPFVLQGKRYLAYQQACGLYIPRQWALLEGPFNLQCVYYMPTRRRVDLVNLLEATCDILVHYGLLRDDNSAVVAAHDGSRVRYDRHNPRAEITLEELEEGEA